MRNNFEACLKEILIHEGGFVNHPQDPGGMTNLGVTKSTYEDWIGYPVSEAIMRKLTPDLVKPLYKRKYWDVVHGDELPTGIDLCVFDFAVNAGPQRAARYLQRMVGAQEDGVIGAKTLSLLTQYVRARGTDYGVMEYQDRRRDYYKILKTFSTFGKGWIRRVKEIENVSLSMVRKKI
jgi:lysozyme family protein